MYDKWWAEAGVEAPSGNHPLYPPEGQKTGSSTFRCKECHGWDYKGAGGAYGSGSHFTGIRGVFGATLTGQETFDIVKSPDGDGTGDTAVNGHDLGGYGLSDSDISDLVEFLRTLVIDTYVYVDSIGLFIGNELQGELNYTTTGLCLLCHGADGTTRNFGTPDDPEWVGTIAVHNPWELLHKIRLGHPNSVMPSWTQAGRPDQGAADIGRYAQLNFPTGTDPIPAVSDWGLVVLLMLFLVAGTLVLGGYRDRSSSRFRFETRRAQ